MVNVFSNGTWSPGLDADSNAVFIPTAFGETNGTGIVDGSATGFKTPAHG